MLSSLCARPLQLIWGIEFDLQWHDMATLLALGLGAALGAAVRRQAQPSATAPGLLAVRGTQYLVPGRSTRVEY